MTGPAAGGRCADAQADNAFLRDWRIEYTLRAELIQNTGVVAVNAASPGNVFTGNKRVVVFF